MLLLKIINFPIVITMFLIVIVVMGRMVLHYIPVFAHAEC